MKPVTQQQALTNVTELLLNAYQKGFDVGFHNLGTSNPYPDDCLEHQCWINGRDQGAQELKLNL